MKKLACISLGCDKNRVDTEYILAKATALGYQICQTISNADIVLINTCAFLESARQEAIETILEVASQKTDSQKLLVAGCLPQKYLQEIVDDLPEVDGFLSINGYLELEVCFKVLEEGKRYIFSQAEKHNDFCNDRILTTPQHYAYLKIADGCKNKCTYCLIPKIRGTFRSTPINQLVDEAQKLVDNGVQEIVLVAQDLTQYGDDLPQKTTLVDLLAELTKLDLQKIRLLYCYPERVTDQLVQAIASNDKIAKYIDIPLQAVSDKLLKLMGRKSNYQSICSLIEKLKAQNIAIRSTFIVGFPQETEEDFLLLCDFLKKYQLDNVGFFAYSDEDVPSKKLSGKVPNEIAQDRLKKLYAITQKIIKSKNKKRIGQVFDVRIDDVDFDKGCFFGRTDFLAPDIDYKVFVRGKDIIQGENYQVKITDVCGLDLVGEIVCP